MDITKLGVKEIKERLERREFSCEQLVRAFIENIERFEGKNAVVEVFSDALDKARSVDEQLRLGIMEGELAGVPIIIKDNILKEGKKASCASAFLKDFVSPYTSTVVEKLEREGAIILGRANMDEFAMGGSNEKSVYGACKNSRSDSKVAGGSSGGSAVSVALNMCACALGTDTGGSVRQPSSFNGVVGLKPTYGRVSRYGVVAFASSLDQVGPITKTVEDSAIMLKVLSGKDKHDQTSLNAYVPDFSQFITGSIEGVRVGVIKELLDIVKTTKYYPNFNRLLEFLKANGASVIELSIKNLKLVLPAYYIIAPAEAASNLGRFDGIKYTTRSKQAGDITELYAMSRTQGFGKEVKKRIMLGNYVLSSGYYDAYYKKAKKLQLEIDKSLNEAFKLCDAIVMPTTLGEAFELGEMNSDPIKMYKEDIFTVLANITGLPAISVPYSKGENMLPLGVQVLSKKLCEGDLFNLADFIEKNYMEAKYE